MTNGGDTFDDPDLGATLRGFDAGQTLFGRYRLEKVLGRGGMGVVWLAHDGKLERAVALKFLPEMVVRDKVAIADLKRETRRCLDLTHPHIVRVYDFMEDDARGLAAISMEYVDGDNLSNIRADREHRCYEVDELRAVIGQLCEALEYAHNKAKVAHRDLKPANLMITSSGDLKVADFGIARSLVDSASKVSAAAGGTSGTPVYMSPQQAQGEQATALDDIYALGATLYDLLTGRPPFYTGNIYEQMKEMVPPSLGERRAKLGVAGVLIPKEWEETIAACLQKDPALRPQSAAEVARRLGLVETAQPVAAPEPVAVPASVPKRQRVMIAALAFLLVCGVFAGWWFGIERTKREAEKNQPAPAEAPSPTIADASKEHPWENSLGMRFVPVPGTKVLFSIWDTRVKDFRAYAQETNYQQQGGMKVFKVKKESKDKYSLSWEMDPQASWEKPGFDQTPEDPVVGVSWDEAKAFCAWLTAKERKEGKIDPGQEYRLPMDQEWSTAVGGYSNPWGNEWPPPKRAGNYFDATLMAKMPGKDWAHHVPWSDGYAYTSPVGSFAPNQYGLYDMGGNVWQWCEDWYVASMNGPELLERHPEMKDDGGGQKYRVLRGASWANPQSEMLGSFAHGNEIPSAREWNFGFRCVLVTSGASQ